MVWAHIGILVTKPTARSSGSGFALPTVLISSIVMLEVLLTALALASSVAATLNNQYLQKVAKEAAESGITYAKYCLAQNGGVAAWTSSAPL